jgi:peptidoglycan lytic transglycosylase
VTVFRRLALGAPAAFAVLSLLLAAGCSSRKAPPPASHPIPPSDLTRGWSEEGLASWYGGDDGFEGKPTASGEIYDSSKLTAAHRDLPLGTVVDVTSLDTGRTTRVRINDRGPFVQGRIIDLSRAAASQIQMIGPGVSRVRLVVVTPGVEIATVSTTGLWAVQVGSFGERPRADRHAERVRAAGFSVYFEPYQGLTRVKVGPVDSRSDAEETLARLEQAGFEGIVVAANR